MGSDFKPFVCPESHCSLTHALLLMGDTLLRFGSASGGHRDFAGAFGAVLSAGVEPWERVFRGSGVGWGPCAPRMMPGVRDGARPTGCIPELLCGAVKMGRGEVILITLQNKSDFVTARNKSG